MRVVSHGSWVASLALLWFAPGALDEERRPIERKSFDAGFAAALDAAARESGRDAVWQIGTPIAGLTAAWSAVHAESNVRAFFGRDGVHVVPRERADWAIGLRLAAYGREGCTQPVAGAEPRVQGAHVAYERGALTEWYLNDAHGLEQGFTLAAAPMPGAEPVELAFELESELAASTSADGRSIRFASPCGESALDYGGLTAWDARGRSLAVRFRASSDALSILLDDRGAEYPITVDPVFVVQQQKLVAAPGFGSSNFGFDVDLQGDRAIVTGLPQFTYVFQRVAGAWVQDVRIAVGNPSNVHSASLEGDTILIGDLSEPGDWNGEAHAWKKIGGIWQSWKVIHQHHGWWSWESMGWNVKLTPQLALISNPDHTHGSGGYRGCVYVMERDPVTDQWTNVDHLLASTGYMGRGLDSDGDTVVATSTTKVMVFDVPAGGAWSIEASIVPPGYTGFGYAYDGACALRGDTLLIGQMLDDDRGMDAGAVSVYVRNGTHWTFQQKLYASDAAPGDAFGSSLAFVGDAIAIGAPKHDGAGADAGAVYVFARNGGWVEEQRFAGADTDANDRFGLSLASSGGELLVGAPIASPPAAYVFDLDQSGPRAYCTPKANSQGCLPQMGFSGTPSVSSGAPFVVSAANAMNNRNGVFFYGTNGRAAAPFQGGLRCVANPVRRMGILSSGGNPPPDDCSGTFTLDFNAWIQSGVDPLLVSGAQVDVQCWSRDPGSPSGTSLSDGLEFVVQP